MWMTRQAEAVAATDSDDAQDRAQDRAWDRDLDCFQHVFPNWLVCLVFLSVLPLLGVRSLLFQFVLFGKSSGLCLVPYLNQDVFWGVGKERVLKNTASTENRETNKTL